MRQNCLNGLAELAFDARLKRMSERVLVNTSDVYQ
jgi:hypothetical protein